MKKNKIKLKPFRSSFYSLKTLIYDIEYNTLSSRIYSMYNILQCAYCPVIHYTNINNEFEQGNIGGAPFYDKSSFVKQLNQCFEEGFEVYLNEQVGHDTLLHNKDIIKLKDLRSKQKIIKDIIE